MVSDKGRGVETQTRGQNSGVEILGAAVQSPVADRRGRAGKGPAKPWVVTRRHPHQPLARYGAVHRRDERSLPAVQRSAFHDVDI